MDFDSMNKFVSDARFWNPFFSNASGESAEYSLMPLPESLSDYSSFDFSYDNVNSLANSQQLQDADLDSFSWSTHNDSDNGVLDPMALDVSDFLLGPLEDFVFNEEEEEEKKRTTPTEKRKRGGEIGGSERRSTSRLNELGFEEIRKYFYMPITKAAQELNVGLTVLKKRCRELGIARWPHRKMKSLKSLIHNELGKGTSEESVRRELENLEEHKRLMEENPEMQMTERTKKLRQACFKANYKRRRLMQDPI
ncbi:hypothetical protein Cni_G29253 [Canna indica]|uniref:RWP-RK domain-containing protein n=1 Tax=Canna indica TaxID=4628 RepID=A0AAQ3L4E7_9LILI|nr:hypothetical protein Cni_G29253 [Canna indica]